MTDNEIRQILIQSYDRASWLSLINSIFSSEIFITPKDISSISARAESILHIGNLKLLDKKNIGVFEIKVESNVNLLKNRVELRNIAFKLIDQDRINGALALYFDETISEYRFSFISREFVFNSENQIISKETSPKRFTYILGPSETCLTPSRRFNILAEKNKQISLNDLFNAFSVESLNDDFFKKYKEIYNKLNKYLLYSNYVTYFEDKENLLNKRTPEKAISEFSKLLLGRIVFLYFVQKKGWLGVPINSKEWKNGNLNFLTNLFNNFHNKSNFYSEVLVKLFFETLNTPRKNDVFLLTNNKIPYLNGGLFDNKYPGTNSIKIPEALFQEIFEFFDSYNFTVDENLPYDSDVGIDPEMLGHIFENLLEENRRKGVFYTPKEIVHYMCQESIINYLSSKFEQKDEQLIASIKNLVRNKVVDKLIGNNAKKINDYLDIIKVCDPAIGSGAFPMGMLKEIYTIKLFLFPYISPQLVFDPAQVKNKIIKNSLYGVDIDSGAVDIARLRFWLSLIVDETYPHPLPNLDYKIMQGDSLLERFEDIDLSKVAIKNYRVEITDGQVEIFSGELKNGQTKFIFNDNETNSIISLLNTYYNESNYERKKVIHKEIDSIVLKNIHINLEAYKDSLLILIADLKKKIEENKSKLKSPKSVEEYLKKSKEFKRLEKLENEISTVDYKFSELKNLESTEDRPYFLWSLYFMDVLNNGGFDIVIGNPPYIQLQKDTNYADKLQKADFETYTRTGDVYLLFYEQGVNKLKKNGTLCFISSNTWMRTKFGKKLRAFLTEKANPLQLINFQDTQIFKHATVETNIIIVQKTNFQNQLKAITLNNNYKKEVSLSDVFESESLPIMDLSEESWVILEANETKVLQTIQSKGIKLSGWDVEFYRGFLTGYNDAFFIDETQKRYLIEKDPKSLSVIKPLIRGRNIKKYVYDFDELYILFIPWHFPLNDSDIIGVSEEAEQSFIKNYPFIYQHLYQFKEELSARNKSETGIRYEWYAMQRAAATYRHIFEKEKIVWLSITDKPAFALDTKGMYVTAPAYIMTSNYNKYLLCLLNSRVSEWYLDKVTSSTGQGANQWSKIFIEQIPIPFLAKEKRTPFEILADYLIFLNDTEMPSVNNFASNEQISKIFEEVMNMMVYELYFKEEMSEKNLDVIHLFNFPNISEIKDNYEKAKIINKIYNNLESKGNPIRERIILSVIKSPDTIGLINKSTH